MPVRIPVTIVGGFLGSGKTTRVNALLREPRGRRIAVVLNEVGGGGKGAGRARVCLRERRVSGIVVVLNEVGAVGRDAGLAGAEEFVELDGGCICCAL